MPASPHTHLLALAASPAAVAGPLLFLAGALLVGACIWLRVRARRQNQRYESALEQLTVAQVMGPANAGVSITASLVDLREQYAESPDTGSLHVTQWGQLVGMISRNDIRRFAEEHWENLRVGAAMTPLERLLTVEPEQHLLEAERLMAHREVERAPVVVRGRVVGMLNRETIRRLIADHRLSQVEETDKRLRQRLPVAN